MRGLFDVRIGRARTDTLLTLSNMGENVLRYLISVSKPFPSLSFGEDVSSTLRSHYLLPTLVSTYETVTPKKRGKKYFYYLNRVKQTLTPEGVL